MPMPVYFDVSGREANVTHDEARELAALLPSEMDLRRSIMSRVDDNVSSLVRLDVGGDEHGNLIALHRAVEALAQQRELSPGLRTLQNRIAAAIDAGT
jgi:hypothetical protein